MTGRWIAGVLLAVAGAALGLALAGEPGSDVGPRTTAAGATADTAGPGAGTASPRGKALPDVVFETLEGAPVRLEEYRGRVVVLNFWGTWCAPCRREIPELADLQRAYRDRGGVVIGVAIDSGEPREIRAFADRYGVNYPIWVSTSDVAVGRFGAIGYPFTVLIGRGGRIRNEWVGPQTVSSLSGEIEALLAEEGGRPTDPGDSD